MTTQRVAAPFDTHRSTVILVRDLLPRPLPPDGDLLVGYGLQSLPIAQLPDVSGRQ